MELMAVSFINTPSQRFSNAFRNVACCLSLTDV